MTCACFGVVCVFLLLRLVSAFGVCLRAGVLFVSVNTLGCVPNDCLSFLDARRGVCVYACSQLCA